MKLSHLLAAGLVVATLGAAVPAQADPGDWHHDRDRHDGRRHHHRHCSMEWHHHHRVQVCR